MVQSEPTVSQGWRITSVSNPLEAKPQPVGSAVLSGLLDLDRGLFFDPLRLGSLPIPLAISEGLLEQSPCPKTIVKGTECALLTFVERKQVNIENVADSYLIKEVRDQMKRNLVPLEEALCTGLIDLESGLYFNQRTDEKLSLKEAFDFGYLKGERITAGVPHLEVKASSLHRFPK